MLDCCINVDWRMSQVVPLPFTVSAIFATKSGVLGASTMAEGRATQLLYPLPHLLFPYPRDMHYFCLCICNINNNGRFGLFIHIGICTNRLLLSLQNAEK
jgi:hypothetical protein